MNEERDVDLVRLFAQAEQPSDTNCFSELVLSALRCKKRRRRYIAIGLTLVVLVMILITAPITAAVAIGFADFIIHGLAEFSDVVVVLLAVCAVTTPTFWFARW